MNQNIQKMVAVVFAIVGYSAVGYIAVAQELITPNGKNVSANNYPFLANRPKVRGYLNHGDTHPIALATTLKNCPSYSYTAWSGQEPHRRSVYKCNSKIDRLLQDYPSAIKNRCRCFNVIEDMKVLNETPLMNGKFRVILKLFMKDSLEKITTERGFLEYEKDELTKQNVKILNAEGSEVCTGSINFSLGPGGFELWCFGGSVEVRGIAEVSVIFSKKHAVGSAVTDNGDVFAFISGLSDSEISNEYPGFPDVVDKSSSPDQELDENRDR
jgi:hypothetical protein